MLEASAGSKAGQHYVVGNGQRVKNEGQLRLNLQTKVSGEINNLDTTFQAAKVSRPLLSVGVICDSGLDVLFKKHEARIMSEDGQTICVFERKDKGLYLARMRLKAPFPRQG